VILRNTSIAKPAFAAKNRGPSALELGYAALLESRFEDAAQAYAQALKVNSEERDALLGLAYIAQEKGRREEAKNYYRRVLRQEPGNAVANSGLMALDAGGDEALSVSRARALAARQPDSAAAMSVAGTALARDGQMADAALAFARAQAIEPASPVHAYNHAVALDRLGRFAQARLQYEKTVELSRAQEVGARGAPMGALLQRLQELRQATDASVEGKP
jgi:tetratricopeptide (TPR) repeat protein